MMGKRFFTLILCLIFLISNINYVSAENNVNISKNIRIIINGKRVNFNNVPIIINSELLLPYNEVLPSLGVLNDKKHIVWNSTDMSVTIYKDTLKLYLKANSKKALINDKAVSLTIVPIIYNKIMYIPVKIVSEKLNKKYIYDDYINAVAICDMKSFDENKSILQKANQMMNSTPKYKVSQEMIIGAWQSRLGIQKEIDKANKINHTSLKISPIGGSDPGSDFQEIYIIGNKVYEKDKEDENWRNTDSEQNENTIFFNVFSFDKIYDSLIAGLSIKKDPVKKEIIFEGDIVPFSQANLDVDNYRAHTKIVLHSDTYYYKGASIEESWVNSGNQHEHSGQKNSFASIERFYDINGDFEIVIPESLNKVVKEVNEIASIIPNAIEVNSLSMKKGKTHFFSASKDKTWKVTVPIDAEGDSWTFEQMIDCVTDTSNYEIVDNIPVDLKEYGLDNPSYTLELGTQKGKTKMIFGNETGNTMKIYAMFENSKKVYAIDLIHLSFLNKPLKEVVNPFAYIVNIQEVNNLTVNFDDKVVSCDIKANKDSKKDKFTVDGKDASAVKDENGNDLFRVFYQSIIGVTISDIEIGAVPKGNAEITFTYKLKVVPYTMKIEFIPKDKDYYYVMKNGEYSNMTVAKKVFDEPYGLRDSYKKLMYGLKK